MYEDFFAKRLTELRLQKGVSARDMSLSIGQSASYINRIENKQMLPSMMVFFYICEYFNITPRDFFDNSKYADIKMLQLLNDLKEIDSDQFNHIAAIVRGLKK